MISSSRRCAESAPLARRIRIARLQKQKFGASSEKIERDIEQLDLALEDLMVATAKAHATPPEEDEVLEQGPPPVEEAEAAPEKTPRRRPRVAQDTPRERRELDPGDACPDCGGALRVVGEDVSELLDMIAAQIKVIEIARVKKSCVRRGNAPSGAFPVPPHLRTDGAGAGAEPADPAQHGRAQPAGVHPRLQIRRPRPALSPQRDLRPDGCRSPSPSGLGPMAPPLATPRTNGGQWLAPDTTMVDWCGGAMKALNP